MIITTERKYFYSPYEQYAHLNGCECTIVGHYIEDDNLRYIIKIDGDDIKTHEAHPEELHDSLWMFSKKETQVANNGNGNDNTNDKIRYQYRIYKDRSIDNGLMTCFIIKDSKSKSSKFTGFKSVHEAHSHAQRYIYLEHPHYNEDLEIEVYISPIV